MCSLGDGVRRTSDASMSLNVISTVSAPSNLETRVKRTQYDIDVICTVRTVAASQQKERHIVNGMR